MKKIVWAAGFAAAIAGGGLWACGGDDSSNGGGANNDAGATTHNDGGGTPSDGGTTAHPDSGTTGTTDAGTGIGSIGDAAIDLDGFFTAPTGTCVTLETCCTSLTDPLEQAACGFVVALGGDDQTTCSQQLASFQEGGMCK